MRLDDIMTVPALTVTPDTTTSQAREILAAKDIHHLVALEGGKVLGVLSARDLARSRAETVREAMNGNPTTATPHTTVREAANLMRGSGIGCLPVVDADHKVVGIVTISDLLEFIGRGAEKRQVRPTRRSQFGQRARHPKAKAG